MLQLVLKVASFVIENKRKLQAFTLRWKFFLPDECLHFRWNEALVCFYRCFSKLNLENCELKRWSNVYCAIFLRCLWVKTLHSSALSDAIGISISLSWNRILDLYSLMALENLCFSIAMKCAFMEKQKSLAEVESDKARRYRETRIQSDWI